MYYPNYLVTRIKCTIKEGGAGNTTILSPIRAPARVQPDEKTITNCNQDMYVISDKKEHKAASKTIKIGTKRAQCYYITKHNNVVNSFQLAP